MNLYASVIIVTADERSLQTCMIPTKCCFLSVELLVSKFTAEEIDHCNVVKGTLNTC